MDIKQWCRGCFSLPSNPLHSSFEDWDTFQRFINPWAMVPRSSTEQLEAVQCVSRELWNSYWLAFGDLCGDHVEILQGTLCSSHSPRIVRVCGPAVETSVDDAVIFSALFTVVVFYARHVGAVEHAEQGEHGSHFSCEIAFSSSGAAQLFVLWISTWRMDSLWHQFVKDAVERFPHVAVNLFEKISSKFRILGGSLQAVLQSSSHSKLNSSILVLGYNIFLATPFLKSLFCGMMGAMDAEYNRNTKTFVIQFADSPAATLAVHALQSSLWKVFGLNLLKQA